MDPIQTVSARFYRDIQEALAPAAPPQPSAGDAMRAAAVSFVETLRKAEETSMDGMVGKADPQSVVTALSSAEIAVQSAVSIRDKVVESYQEILRMPV